MEVADKSRPAALLGTHRVAQAELQRTVFSRQGLQKAWLQGMHSGCSSTPLQMPQVNSRSARSCWLICSGVQPWGPQHSCCTLS